MRYLINKDWHYAMPLQLIKKLLVIRYTTKRAMSAVVRFHSWRWLNGNLELCSYIYENGLRVKEMVLCKCDFNTNYKIYVYLYIEDGKYCVYYYVNSELKHCQQLATKVKKYVSYPLSLYFGGNCTAPHDMTIDMNVKYDKIFA